MLVAVSYTLIIVVLLVLLNTYPLIASQNMVFRSKQTALQSGVSVMVSALSGLDVLTESNVGQAMTVAEETAVSRVLVTDAAGRVLYDDRETDNAMGDFALYTEIIDALSGSDVFYSRYHDGVFRSRAASPVIYRGQIIGAVYVYDYDLEQAELLSALRKNLMRISVVTGIVVLIMGFAISRLLAIRFNELLRAIRITREGDYNHRAVLDGTDEFAELAAEFNLLTDRLQATEQARRRFVSDASHELKTPLASIRLLADSILQTEEIDAATAREFVGDIKSESERLARITEGLLRLTKLDESAPRAARPVAVMPVVERVVHMLRLSAEEYGVTLTAQSIDPQKHDCLLCGSEDDLYQILYNLTENAVKYSRRGGFVRLCVSYSDAQVVLTVEDDGIGIPADELTRIFDRFYRVDKARSRAAGGTGLGLSIVHDTAVRCGGTVQAGQRSGGGAVFTVRFPAAKEDTQ